MFNNNNNNYNFYFNKLQTIKFKNINNIFINLNNLIKQ